MWKEKGGIAQLPKISKGVMALRQAGDIASKFESLPIVSKILKFDPVEGQKMIDYSANKILRLIYGH